MEIQPQIDLILKIAMLNSGALLAMVAMYGYWIWDLNKKISTAVTGAECESRNESQYGCTRDLRLEVKDDVKDLRKTITDAMLEMAKSNQACVETMAKAVEKLGSKE